ncbi:3-oxoacyl-[acyl-carrier protein] reductase [Hamadaea flava]|uniref:SDR family NAD(P)-dependent oxidoreductase n=1 Tax=Hamadaea flava TaxID=1742688 RepID=A0ABV8LV66_9ACTN|nr:SDR family oxidoreductase [Hamadaea flava]MCP2327862.1 3-oxoacyl-[acyl-carrier protein] reductase [Hamadaea flava]
MSAKLAVVSGGGTGIGAAITRTLAEDGYEVIIAGRREEPLARVAAEVSGVTAVVADLADPDQVTRVADAVGERAVDVLVNNAGGFVMSDGDSLADEAAQWRRTFDVNVLTAVLLTSTLEAALRRPGGRVILLSSIAAQRGGAGAYSAAKAALHGWMFDLAARLGPDGVTANVVSPGYVAETEFFGTRMTPEGHALRVGQTLVGRAGVPDDIAAAVRWLAGDSGGYVTGQIIGVNGGSVLGR